MTIAWLPPWHPLLRSRLAARTPGTAGEKGYQRPGRLPLEYKTPEHIEVETLGVHIPLFLLLLVLLACWLSKVEGHCMYWRAMEHPERVLESVHVVQTELKLRLEGTTLIHSIYEDN